MTIEISTRKKKAGQQSILFIIFYTTAKKKPIDDTSLCWLLNPLATKTKAAEEEQPLSPAFETPKNKVDHSTPSFSHPKVYSRKREASLISNDKDSAFNADVIEENCVLAQG